MTQIINLFGGPGTGKSTIAAGLFYELKRKHINCELPYEYAKQLTWDNSAARMADQLYILAKQHRAIVRSYGKVDYTILDSPILLSLVYKNMYNQGYPVNRYDNINFDNLVVNLFKSYDNINFLLERHTNAFQADGRNETLEQATDLDGRIRKVLEDNNIEFTTLEVGQDTVERICSHIGM